mgnify:CR=1 FL=1
MKKQELNLEQIQEKVQKLRSELESQLNLLNNYVNDFELIEASEFYYKSKRGREKFIDFKDLKFHFKKYFVDAISRTFGRKLILGEEICKQITELAKTFFNKEEYVLVVCSNDMSSSSENMIRQVFELLKSKKVGKIMIAGRGDELEEGLVLSEIIPLENERIKVCVNEVKYDVCVYEGAQLLNQNIILIGDEFGYQNSLTKIIIESKPKSVLNLLVNSSHNPFWIDNVD